MKIVVSLSIVDIHILKQSMEQLGIWMLTLNDFDTLSEKSQKLN